MQLNDFHVIEITDKHTGSTHRDIVYDDVQTFMKSPPPCGDITPMEVVSNSRAEPQS